MLRYEPASSVDPETLAELWNRCYPEKYRVDGDLIRNLGREHPSYLDDASWVAYDDSLLVGFVEVKSSAADLYSGPVPDIVHIHSLAFLNEVTGTGLIMQVLGMFSDKRIQFGQDNGHFWPGVPEEWEAGFEVLEGLGFQWDGEWHQDVQQDLQGFDYPEATKVLERPGVRMARGRAEDAAVVDEFFRAEFPGRWRYDTLSKFATEPSDIFLLWIADKIEGFAFTQSWESTKHPIAGAVWHHSLGENWGALGPIGVSKRLRGLGLGGAVLVQALNGMRDAGVRQCAIDWTALVDFYGKYGFETSRRYKGMALGV